MNLCPKLAQPFFFTVRLCRGTRCAIPLRSNIASEWRSSSPLRQALQCPSLQWKSLENGDARFRRTQSHMFFTNRAVSGKRLISGKKRAHKFKKNARDTGRVSLGHPAGQTGVYRPVSQGVPVNYYRKTLRKGHFFFPGHRPGVPGTPGHPGGFQKIYVIFSYVPFLLSMISFKLWDTLWEQLFCQSGQSALIDASLWRNPL